MHIRNFNKPSFGAIKIATTKNVIDNKETNIDIYKITPKDNEYLRYLKDTIDITALAPKYNNEKIDFWQKVFNITIRQAQQDDKTALLAVCNNKPCGILVYTSDSKKFFANTATTWPIEPNKKVPFTYRTLCTMMLKDFLSSNAYFTELNAISSSPFSPVAKCMLLGFRQTGGENNITHMRISKQSALKTIEKSGEIIKITPRENQQDVNLFDILG